VREEATAPTTIPSISFVSTNEDAHPFSPAERLNLGRRSHPKCGDEAG
jgi:hypothetical protein